VNKHGTWTNAETRHTLHWDGGMRTWVRCARDRQFIVARDLLAQLGDGGKLHFERVNKHCVEVHYSLGEPMPDPYCRLAAT
jgi:hypothetical protein